MNSLWLWVKPVSKALISKGLSKDNSGSNLGHFDPCNFAEEWHCPTSARINFKDVHLMIMNNKLDVHNADTFKRNC